jgi:hypothetical protein
MGSLLDHPNSNALRVAAERLVGEYPQLFVASDLHNWDAESEVSSIKRFQLDVRYALLKKKIGFCRHL